MGGHKNSSRYFIGGPPGPLSPAESFSPPSFSIFSPLLYFSPPTRDAADALREPRHENSACAAAPRHATAAQQASLRASRGAAWRRVAGAHFMQIKHLMRRHCDRVLDYAVLAGPPRWLGRNDRGLASPTLPTFLEKYVFKLIYCCNYFKGSKLNPDFSVDFCRGDLGARQKGKSIAPHPTSGTTAKRPCLRTLFSRCPLQFHGFFQRRRAYSFPKP